MKRTIKRRLTTATLFSSLAIAPLALAVPATTANAQNTVSPTGTIVLSIGRGELINIPGAMADVFIANDAIADVQIKSQRQLYIFGKAGGETTIYASNAAGDIIWSTNIRIGNNIDSVDQMLALAMPEAQVSVATMGSDTVLLTGTVAAPEDASEAERLVQAFVGEETNVISRLRMATPLQVNLQVKFAEVSRSLVRELGTNLTTFDGSGGIRFGIGNGRDVGAGTFSVDGPLGVGAGVTSPSFVLPDGTTVTGPGVQSQASGSSIGILADLLGLNLLGTLDLAERNGLLTTLSQPNLTALSGESAEFLAGGEFPIPVSQGLGTTAIEYRKFGVSLSYTPTVLANGRISLSVRPEVSELSTQGSVTLNGFVIPALTIRRADTTIELGSGQSFMIAGLMSNSSQNSIDKAPGIGDVPILGNLFRSSSYLKGETELVIVVTPYLVNPVNANEIVLPTDGFRAPNEIQRTFGYQESDGVTGGSRPMPTASNSSAPPPEISRIDPQAVLPGAASPTPSNADKGDKRRDRRAEADTTAVPGFSIK